MNEVKCKRGNAVSFRCPCCPEEFDDCRFKKLFQGGYIVLRGKVNQPSKYELNDSKTNITLKECHEDDEGTYVWMCGSCNVNRQYRLEFIPELKVKAHHLKCHSGGNVKFERPRSDDLNRCKFKKMDDQDYISRNSAPNDPPRFEFDELKDHITLRNCSEEDGGIYGWMCEENIEENKFRLEILHDADVDHKNHAFNMCCRNDVHALLLYVISFLISAFSSC